jgi:hypothetical protein
MMNSTIHMFSAGAATFLLKGLLGNHITKYSVSYLGEKRGLYLQIGIYVFNFFYVMSILDSRKRLNVNYLINAREFNGEIMMNIILKSYPQKVNHSRYRQILMEKYENQILKMNSMDHITNPDNIGMY